MNLDQITTKCWILALFIRDDGERLLLGDGWFDFKDSLQHFQPNSIANDIVELQGTDGQLLAGQVRRSASQSFDGYVGDALTSKTEIENRRRQFIQFFRTRRHYKVIYIFPDGTAIQRRMGYLTDAPSVPEMWQKFPEYHVALNFEDVNYYEYAEDAQGDEIYAHDSLVKLISVQSGGLVWDEDGAVSHGYTWLDPQTVTGDYITVTDGATSSPLTLSQLTGNATQNGTPTPDAPVAIETVTGGQTVDVVGKNLHGGYPNSYSATRDGITFNSNTDGTISVAGTATGNNAYSMFVASATSLGWVRTYRAGTYTLSGGSSNVAVFFTATDGSSSYGTGTAGKTTFTLTAPHTAYIRVLIPQGATVDEVVRPQLELGSTATAYEPYQGQEFEINLGKNLLDVSNVNTGSGSNGLTITANSDGSLTWAGTTTATWAILTTYTTVNLKAGTYTLSIDKTLAYRFYVEAMLEDNTTQNMIIEAGQTSKTLTFAKNIKQIRLDLANITNGQAYNETVKAQFEQSATPSSYAPYFTPIELAKIGTYQDRIYKDDSKWYIRRAVGKAVLDGSENITEHSTRNNILGVRLPVPSPAVHDVEILNNYFQNVSFEDYYSSSNTRAYGTICAHNAQDISTLYASAPDSSVATVADFKTWLASHPTTVYYALATPTTTEITDETLLSQLNFIASLYGGVNNISITGTGAQGEMTLNYYADVDTTGAGYEWEAGEGGGPTIVQVIGVDNAQPIWTVTGPATNPTLTNITTIQTITWNGTVPNGQKLIVDMANQTATLAGANVYEFITGSWLTLSPGANKLTYSAQGADQASQIQWNGVVG